MDLKDYKDFFYEDTEITEEEDFIILEVKALENQEDKEWEFSIQWSCNENDEKGEIKGINTSSIWALKSLSWIDEYDDEY